MENIRTRICICYLITSFLISVFIYTLISGNLQNNRVLARLREEVDEISHVVLHSGSDCRTGFDNKQLTDVIEGILKKKLAGIWDDLYTLKKHVRGAECAGLGGGRRNAITATDTAGGGQMIDHRINYASEDLGARIHAVVAVPICPTNIIKQLLNLDFSSNPPVCMLRQSMDPGNCFGFRNNKSEVTIKLAKEIYIEIIEVSHISRAHSPIDDISSAPRKFFVYGIDGNKYDMEFCLGSFEFVNNGSCVQTFPIKTLIRANFAYERRFPKCPQMPIVLDCEIVKDEILENGAKHNTSRRCKLAVDAPYIFKKLIGVDFVYFLQHNYLDKANRTLNIEAVNESFSSRIEIFERCRYYAHPDNPDWTCFDQIATLDIKNFFGFEHSMEKMGMKQYTQTTLKGKEIIEFFIEELKADGVTEVERWVPTVDTVATATVAEDELPDEDKEKNGCAGAERRKSSAHEQHHILLDGDFIAKNLGQLSPMQESKLLELRKMLDGVDDLDKMPSYQTILRFLTARDWHVNQAFAMLKDSLKWRKEHNIDSLVKEYKVPSVVVNHFPGAWHHYDKDGRPIYILRLGHMDVKGLLKSIGAEGLLKLSLHICEEGMQKIKESAENLGKPVLSWCLIVDLDGLSMRHLWRPGVKALLNIIETVERNYPETMGRVLVVRAPRVFPIAWTIVSAFIHENTRSKFLFYGGPDCLHMQDGLEQYIDSEIIPNFLGGPCKTLIHEGGLVPKTLYKMNSLEEDDEQQQSHAQEAAAALVPAGGGGLGGGHEHQNLYKTVELRTGYMHEVVIRNEDPKSVLTWDFDVMRSDLHFTLFRVTKELPNKHDSAVSFFDLSDFIEGEHFFKEEPTLICRHKESVQGSHVMHYTDSYIMQWFSPSMGADGPAQLNFFYEILSSVNYKGSMTSLQSGFSSSSVASSCQSR